MPAAVPRDRPEGVVAVIPRGRRLLVIQRAHCVVAPLAFCFPGGGRGSGESEELAVRREVREELGIDVDPRERIWRSVTPWGVSLAWWLAFLPPGQTPEANPAEVASWDWYTPDQLQRLPKLLASNRSFLSAWQRGEIPLRLE